MNKEIEMSIIVPVYNGENYINRCIEQLISQNTRNEFEIIFIDDGSTDNTCKIIEEYQEKNTTLKLYRQNHKGVSCARNFGMEKASGQWLIFCDVDDTIKQNYLSDIENRIQDNTHTDIFIYARHHVKPDSKVITEEDISRTDLLRVLLSGEDDTILGKDFLLVPVWSKVYRAAFLKEKGLQFIANMQFCEDWLFQLDAFIAASHIDFVYRGYYKYEQNAGSVVHRARKNDTNNAKIMQNHIEALADKYFDKKLKRVSALSLYDKWRTTISSELLADIADEKYFGNLHHLYKIQSLPEYKRMMDRCKKYNKFLSKRERFNKTIIEHFQPLYILFLYIGYKRRKVSR